MVILYAQNQFTHNFTFLRYFNNFSHWFGNFFLLITLSIVMNNRTYAINVKETLSSVSTLSLSTTITRQNSAMMAQWKLQYIGFKQLTIAMFQLGSSSRYLVFLEYSPKTIDNYFITWWELKS